MVIAILVGCALMAVATFAIVVAARWLGPRLAIGGHTEDTTELAIKIGQDTLRLPANMLRFSEQRHAGLAERVDLYLAWPEIRGYAADLKTRFDDRDGNDGLIFLQISQSTMSQDMSGRVEPIYSRLFDGPPAPGPHGLTLHRLRADSGYGSEILLTDDRHGGGAYAVRCLMPSAPAATATVPSPPAEPTHANNSDCQRDIRAGQDLTVLYRFSSALLRDWHHIDAAIARFVRERIVTANPANPGR